MGAAHQLDDSTLSDIYRYVVDETAMISITDNSGRITYVNDNFCKISGYQDRELMGKDHKVLNSGYHSKTFFQNMWKTLHEGSIWKGEIKNKDKDGNFYWVDTMIMPLLGENNQVENYLSVRFDITVKKEAEELLKFFIDESHRTSGQKFFTQLIQKLCGFLEFEYGFVGEYFSDTQIVTTHTLLVDGEQSPNFTYPIAGAPCEVAIKTKKSTFYTEGVQEKFPDDHDLCEMHAESYIGFPLTDENKKVIGLVGFLSKSRIPVDKVNRTVQVVEHFYQFIVQELLRQKSNTQLEYQKRMIEEMEKLSSMGTLAAFLGHEINNSLQIIKGNVSRIQKHLKDISIIPEKVTSSLENISKVSTNLSMIVRGIKSLSHSGEKLKQEPLLFHEIVEENKALIDLKNKETGAIIEIELPEDINIIGNRTQLGQVVVNLMTNSLDAIQSCEEKWVKVKYNRVGDRHFIYFTDSGNGIP